MLRFASTAATVEHQPEPQPRVFDVRTSGLGSITKTCREVDSMHSPIETQANRSHSGASTVLCQEAREQRVVACSDRWFWPSLRLVSREQVSRRCLGL